MSGSNSEDRGRVSYVFVSGDSLGDVLMRAVRRNGTSAVVQHLRAVGPEQLWSMLPPGFEAPSFTEGDGARLAEWVESGNADARVQELLEAKVSNRRPDPAVQADYEAQVVRAIGARDEDALVDLFFEPGADRLSAEVLTAAAEVGPRARWSAERLPQAPLSVLETMNLSELSAVQVVLLAHRENLSPWAKLMLHALSDYVPADISLRHFLAAVDFTEASLNQQPPPSTRPGWWSN